MPEVGAFIATLLPLPLILFDSRLPSPGTTMIIAFFGQGALKFLFGNIVEVKLVESDKVMRLHPVVLLLGV